MKILIVAAVAVASLLSVSSAQAHHRHWHHHWRHHMMDRHMDDNRPR